VTSGSTPSHAPVNRWSRCVTARAPRLTHTAHPTYSGPTMKPSETRALRPLSITLRGLAAVSALVLLALAPACEDDKGSTTPDAAAPRDGSPDTATADAGATGDASGDTTAASFAPVACTGQTDKTKPITDPAPRKVYCALDLGSNNIKLQVISMEEGKPLSFKDERQCRTRLGFGAKVFDSQTMTAKALPAADIADLITVMKELQAICALDKGKLVGAEATQWARDTLNIADVKAQVKTATGLDIEVLTPEQEGAYGYVAGTRNAPERLSLDPGSNSFQIGWWPKGATAARTVSVPLGYVRGAAKHYPEATATDTYAVAKGKHAAELVTLLDQALGKLTPPSSVAALKADIAVANLKPEIFVVGQDGALHLAVRASLRDPQGKWIDSKKAYDDRVALEKPTADPMFGDVTTLLTPAELAMFFSTVVKEADYTALRTAPVRPLYGEKALANTVLLDTLIQQLGLTTVVLVPQEMPAGYILANLNR
jgi:hypothetical protein